MIGSNNIQSSASEKPDPDSLTKQVSCTVKSTATCASNSCTLTVYVPLLGSSAVTQPFLPADPAAKYAQGAIVTCYVNQFYENYDTQLVSMNQVQTNFSYVMSVIGGVMLGAFFLLLLVTIGLSYYSCSMLIRP